MSSCETDVWSEDVRQASSALSSARSSTETIAVGSVWACPLREKIIGGNFTASRLPYLTFISLCGRAGPCLAFLVNLKSESGQVESISKFSY